jgi:hypothetical protein
MCRCVLVDTTCTFVCIKCGLEKAYLSPSCVSFNHPPHSQLVVSPYSRKTRFTGLLRKILGVDNGPLASDLVWNYLAGSAPFQTTEDIIMCLKNSPLKTKYYNSIHVFAKAFLRKYETPNCIYTPLQIENSLGQLFEEVVFQWCRFSTNPSFFSYSWLLEKLFKQLQIFENYQDFMKVLICPTRRLKYETRWKTLVTRSVRLD